MKSILIVTEIFEIGGLETHIRGEIHSLTRAGCSVHLATGHRFNSLLLPQEVASVSNNLSLGPEATLSDLIATVEDLRRLIRTHGIECIHAHPFTSLIPSLIAAEMEEIPFALTLHGPASLASYYGPLYDFLLTSVVLPNTDLVVAVSREVADLASPYLTKDNAFILPNGVDVTAFAPGSAPVKSDPRWLIVGRLDSFKVIGIADFIQKAKSAGLPGVLLVGDGPAKVELQQRLNRDGLTGFVEFHGTSADVPMLMQAAAGVAGMGRVVLEGLASLKPVCLVGYDGVKGVVDQDLLWRAAQANFSGRYLKNIDDKVFCKQITQVQIANTTDLYKIVNENFSESDLWKKFAERLKTITFQSSTLLSDAYRHLLISNSNENLPMMQSTIFIEQLGSIIHSNKHLHGNVFASFFYYKNKFLDMNNRLSLTTMDEKFKIIKQNVAELYEKIDTLSDQIFGLTQIKEERDIQLSKEHLEQIGEMKRAVIERAEQIVNLNRALAEHDKQISSLTQAVVERDRQIAVLNQNVAEYDMQVKLHESYRIDKEFYIAQLLEDISMRDQGLFGMIWRMKLRILRIPHYINRSWQLLIAGGVSSLYRAVDRKICRRDLVLHTSQTQQPPNGQSQLLVKHMAKSYRHLLDDELVVITGVPFDDIGGGQRGAQLARTALKTGRKIIYIYVYRRYDFETNKYVESNIDIIGLTHVCIDNISPSELLGMISARGAILIEFPHPKILPFLNLAKTKGVKTIFELIDDWETSLGGDWFEQNIFNDFINKADTVVGTSKILQKRLIDRGRSDALYLPNAANEYIFDKYKNFQRPADMPSKGKKTALYFGSLYGEWFAWDYINASAELNPDLNIILVGDSPQRKGFPGNIYFLGEKSIDQLPAYLFYSDIALLPFSPGKISESVSPIKIFEYLFMGKPVISTCLPEIANYPGVHIAHTPIEFSQLCGSVSMSVITDFENDRFISNNSWFKRLDTLIMENSVSELYVNSISAIILIHNNIRLIGRCLESLLKHGAGTLKEVIVVDNASSDGGADFVAENFPTVRIIKNPINGCSSGRNLGASVATGKYLAFFDSDQWFTGGSGFIEALTILERNTSIGAVGWAAGWFDKKRGDLGGMIVDYCSNRAMDKTAIFNGFRLDIGYLGTGGFFLPKIVFEATNGFDKFYDPTCFEDTDFCFQIKALGLNICYRDLTGIRHQPHQTTKANSQNREYTKLFMRNSDYFKKKWSKNPEFFLDYNG